MRYYNKLQADANHRIVPEDRLYGVMYMAIFMPIGLFIYSFTQYGKHEKFRHLAGFASPAGFGLLGDPVLFVSMGGLLADYILLQDMSTLWDPV